jgi:hypothetical protein
MLAKSSIKISKKLIEMNENDGKMNVNILIPTLMKGDRQNNDTDDTII